MAGLKKLWGNREYREIFGLFLATRFFIVLLGMLSVLVINKGRWFSGKTFFPPNFFFNWDSNWYLSIVQHGYNFIPGKESSVAFFPLYPLLVKIFSFYTSNTNIIIATGFVISNLACLLACFYLYKLIRIDYPETTSFRAVLFLLIYPVSFFFSVFYSEGLFIFLVITIFYYARIKRWPIVALLGFFLPLTRSIGIFTLIPLAVEYLDLKFEEIALTKAFFVNTAKRIRLDCLYLLSLPLGALAYMSYMYLKFGNPLIYITAQLPWGTKFSSILTTWHNSFNNSVFYLIIFQTTIILAIVITLYLFCNNVRLSYLTYLIIFIFFYLSANNLQSTPRFVGVLFPIFLGLALFSEKSRLREYVTIILSVIMFALMTILYTNGYWLT